MGKNIWTLERMPDLQGKIIVVTGGNSGLGYESVKAFARNSAELILACRSVEKGNAAKAEIVKDIPKAMITVKELDLSDLSSVHAFADDVNANYTKLDILLNNAGIMTPPYGLTKDGFESQFGTNHLGHFALTARLFSLIKATAKSRVVNVSSMAHNKGEMSFDNLNYDDGKTYNSMKAYRRSKMANLYFTYELQRKLQSAGIDAISVAAHPGVSQTNLGRFIEGKLLYKLLWPVFKAVTQPAFMGALPQIRAAVDVNVKGGEYYGPSGVNEFKGYPVIVKSSKPSYDVEIAKKLWEWSEELCNVKFEI